MNRQLLTLLLVCTLAATHGTAKPIDRQRLVGRNSPVVTSVDTLASLSVGNGRFAMTTDVTGLQTFPEYYRNGVPLGTQSEWGWHSDDNPHAYRIEESYQLFDFGHGHRELYATQPREGRAKEAADWYRANPHRLHLGCIGLEKDGLSPRDISKARQHLDLWTGTIHSRFNLGRQCYEVTTLCHPRRDMVGVRVQGRRPAVNLRFAYPTAKHSDDACDWASNRQHTTQLVAQTEQGATLKRQLGHTEYYVTLSWEGRARLYEKAPNYWVLAADDDRLTLCCTYSGRSLETANPSFAQTVADCRDYWQRFWTEGAAVDFSGCCDPRAPELERRVVLSQYLLAIQCTSTTPPQETGLTYNSWFGKFHLEMIWWHQAWLPLWGHTALLERTLPWYHKAAPMAREIAMRQGFQGIRWMKMTDPSAEEAPSKVGSFLIWQQPHLIYLAELLRRAEKNDNGRRLLDKFGPLVNETAAFMFDFADYDAARDRYILKGIIPAQETLRAAETVNPPFELSYWHWGMQTALQWQQLRNEPLNTAWQRLVGKLSPLAHTRSKASRQPTADALYLAAESATDTYTDIRFTSDHPALLGAYGILPATPQVDTTVMRNTLRWIWDNWNWDKTWGWDYPMVAMTAARLNEPQKAVDALLMDKRTNTYLVSGHNYQDQRLRLYLPGNGGLLTALAMMCAGWDGCERRNPGFPADGKWDVRWEGLLPMP